MRDEYNGPATQSKCVSASSSFDSRMLPTPDVLMWSHLATLSLPIRIPIDRHLFIQFYIFIFLFLFVEGRIFAASRETFTSFAVLIRTWFHLMCMWREFFIHLFFYERNELHNRQINAKCVKIDDYMSVYGIDTCILDLVDLTLCVDIIRKYSHSREHRVPFTCNALCDREYNLIWNRLRLWEFMCDCACLLNAATCSLPSQNKILHEYIFFASLRPRFEWQSACRRQWKWKSEDLIACAFVCRH